MSTTPQRARRLHQRDAHRRVIASAIGATVLTLATAAAPAALEKSGLDPRRLVLQESEVPAAYALDRPNSRFWPNAAVARNRADLTQLFARTGRVNGYRSTYKRVVGPRIRYISSTAETHRTSEGAGLYLSWIDAGQKKSNRTRERKGQEPYIRLRVGIGERGWAYIEGPPAYYVLVAWRHGRVVGSVQTWGIGVQRTLALARTQQRRIATTVR